MQVRVMILTVLLSTVLVCPVAAAPTTSAASAVLMDGDTGRILYAQDENTPRPMASTTKLMTALVAVESLGGDLARPVKIQPEWTGIEGTSLYLRPGEILQVETLLYGLLLHSGNDAAVALAGYCAGDVATFVEWMNQRAVDLGMTRTHFSDPNGLGDAGHYASALDMAKLGRACLHNETIARIVATKSITLEGRALTNHNKLLWQYDGCTGMKTGYTRQAGRTLVSSARREGQNLIDLSPPGAGPGRGSGGAGPGDGEPAAQRPGGGPGHRGLPPGGRGEGDGGERPARPDGNAPEAGRDCGNDSIFLRRAGDRPELSRLVL